MSKDTLFVKCVSTGHATDYKIDDEGKTQYNLSSVNKDSFPIQLSVPNRPITAIGQDDTWLLRHAGRLSCGKTQSL